MNVTDDGTSATQNVPVVTYSASTLNVGPQPASLEDLELHCVGAGQDFIMSQLKEKATIDQALSTWVETLNKQIAAAERRVIELEAEVEQLKSDAKAAADVPGVEPDEVEPDDTERGGTARDQWNALIKQQVDAGMSKQKAARAVSKSHPELRELVVAEANEGKE